MAMLNNQRVHVALLHFLQGKFYDQCPTPSRVSITKCHGFCVRNAPIVLAASPRLLAKSIPLQIAHSKKLDSSLYMPHMRQLYCTSTM